MYFFYKDIAQKIMAAIESRDKEICLSLDLNLSKRVWQIDSERLILDSLAAMDMENLKPIAASSGKIYAFENNCLFPVEVRSNGYYKLVPTAGAPTLEIDGIKMHRSKDMDPFTDAELKTKLVVRAGDQVLDTCGGLGYSALFAIKAGARQVISTEKSPEVIQLRNLNPWLTQMDQTRLVFCHTDITRHMDTFEANQFNSVIHDPPRFTAATGDLYGRLFYDALFRVMAPGARLFHYTGSPGRITAKDTFIKNTQKRLAQSGFSKVHFKEPLQGMYAEKSRHC
jgi:hypothetical protein